jgi:putative flippase GtrA
MRSTTGARRRCRPRPDTGGAVARAGSAAHHRDAAPKLIIVSFVGILTNLFMMYVLVAIFDVYGLAARIVAGAGLGWNLVGNRYWTSRGDLAVR